MVLAKKIARKGLTFMSELQRMDEGIKQSEKASRIQFLTNELHKLGVYHIKAPKDIEHVQLSIEDYTNTIHSQAEKGLEKYGQAMDPLDDYDWLEMATEELIDGHQYVVAEKRKREYIVSKIRRLLDMHNYQSDGEIHFWLDKLEGK